MGVEKYHPTRRQFAWLGLSALAAGGKAFSGESSKRRFRFFLWNDLHVRDPDVPSRPPAYPFANEKAAWAAECAKGLHDFEPPDFIVSAGDIIDGEIPDYDRDFTQLKISILSKLPVPFLPCLGNHENGQGEGIPEQNRAFDRCFGPRWHNYVFTCGGVGFVIVDTSGAHRQPDDVTAARNAFVVRALDRLEGMPVMVVTHVPLIAMREEEPLTKSFGFSSWRVLDTRMLEIVEKHRDRVVAVLCGHLHMTGVRQQEGIWHIMSAGTAGYPSDFASLDVFDDRIEVQMHKVPEQWLDRRGNTHGKPRHPVDYTDAEHPDHESYLRGNAAERRLTVPLQGPKRPRDDVPQGLDVFLETAPGRWESGRDDPNRAGRWPSK